MKSPNVVYYKVHDLRILLIYNSMSQYGKTIRNKINVDDVNFCKTTRHTCWMKYHTKPVGATTAMLDLDNVSHNCCPWCKGHRCAMALTQGHISKVKVTVHTYPKWVSKQLLFTVMLDPDNILHNCCPCPKGVMTFKQGHILKVKVTKLP